MSSEEKKSHRSTEKAGLHGTITRRDFVGSTLVGSGAALLSMQAPSLAHAASPKTADSPAGGLGANWTGPGGVGDYAASNGNTHHVVNAAHKIARGGDLGALENSGEVYDLVIVGGGFSGLAAAFTFWEQTGGKGQCLILDNHPIFGGHAKANRLDVDGHQIYGQQASSAFALPTPIAREMGFVNPLWDKLDLPDAQEFKFVEPPQRLRGKLNIARESFGARENQANTATTGFFYPRGTENGGNWVIDPLLTDFKGAPMSDSLKRELMAFLFYDKRPAATPTENWQAWLDSMTYKQYIENVLGFSPAVTAFVDPMIATGMCGTACDAVSAYFAYQFALPGLLGFHGVTVAEVEEKLHWGMFPGGNSGFARHFVKKMMPDAIPGDYNIWDIHNNPVNQEVLDRPGNPVRMRFEATVCHVQHDGDPQKAKQVNIVYHKQGRRHLVRARSVVMASGQWLNKHILADQPYEFSEAFKHFHYGPMMIVNVGLRNWRFAEKLGATAFRWFDGELGWWSNIIRNIDFGEQITPLDPDKPIMLANFVPLLNPGADSKTQSMVSRYQLFSMSYRDIEMKMRKQYTQMFGKYGFDADRDIAGIIANRWGHAYISPAPGFFFGRNGNLAPSEVVREGYGRISFGHSDTRGQQLMNVAVAEGMRAAEQAMQHL